MSALPRQIHPFDLIPCEGTGVTLDKLIIPVKPMTEYCALQIIQAEKKWGRGTIRKELLDQARAVLTKGYGDSYDVVESDEFQGKGI